MSTSFSDGIHGQTYISSNLERTRAFLVDRLGLRLLKCTVHHHDERLKQYYFGFDESTSLPDDRQAVVSFIEWHPIFYTLPPLGLLDLAEVQAALNHPRVGDGRGRWGGGTNHHLAFHVRSRESLLKWKRHLSDAGVNVTGPYDRNFFHAIYFREPDGAIFEIATTQPGFRRKEEIQEDAPEYTLIGVRSEDAIAAETWADPIPEMTPDMTLAGFHHITSVCLESERTADFYVEKVGLDLIKRTEYMDAPNGTHYYYSALPDAVPGAIITFFGFPDQKPGQLGIGLAHHFTLAAKGDAALAEWQEILTAKGVHTTPIQDHLYFNAFYFSDPDGHICSVATRPNFTLDEDASSLGSRLCLPVRLEPRRAEIERYLTLKPAPAPISAGLVAYPGI